MGGKAPQCLKMGILKPKAWIQGGWEKHNKINSFRIIGQGILKLLYNFKWGNVLVFFNKPH